MTGVIPFGFMKSASGGGGNTIVDSATLTTGLESYHSLESTGDNVEGTATYDMTLSGAVFTASGKIDYGVQCDGVNDYMYQTNPFSAGTGDCSANFWVKLDATADTEERAFIGAWGSKNWILLRIDAAGTSLKADIVQAGYYVRDDAFVSHGLTMTDWNMITLTYEASSHTAKLYFNGSYVRDLPTSSTSSSGGRQYIQWGCYGGTDSTAGTSRFCDGTMDEIGTWSKVLTSDEVTELYNSGDGLPYD